MSLGDERVPFAACNDIMVGVLHGGKSQSCVFRGQCTRVGGFTRRRERRGRLEEVCAEWWRMCTEPL